MFKTQTEMEAIAVSEPTMRAVMNPQSRTNLIQHLWLRRRNSIQT